MKPLSKRDQALALAVPTLAVLFFYGWYGYKPLVSKRAALEKKMAGYGAADEEGLAVKIRAARKQLEATKAAQKESLDRIAAEKAKMEQENRWAGDLPTAERFQRVTKQLGAAHLQLLSAKLSDKTAQGEETGGLPTVVPGLTAWTLRVRGTFSQMRDFLSSNTTAGWVIPVTLDMSPAIEPGKPAEWDLSVLL
jgi:hypothetical protein